MITPINQVDLLIHKDDGRLVVKAGDPLLTARVEGVYRQPRRVVFDSEARLPVDSALVRGAQEVPVTVICTRAASRGHVQSLESAGVDVVRVRGDTEAARVTAGPGSDSQAEDRQHHQSERHPDRSSTRAAHK